MVTYLHDGTAGRGWRDVEGAEELKTEHWQQERRGLHRSPGGGELSVNETTT